MLQFSLPISKKFPMMIATIDNTAQLQFSILFSFLRIIVDRFFTRKIWKCAPTTYRVSIDRAGCSTNRGWIIKGRKRRDRKWKVFSNHLPWIQNFWRLKIWKSTTYRAGCSNNQGWIIKGRKWYVNEKHSLRGYRILIFKCLKKLYSLLIISIRFHFDFRSLDCYQALDKANPAILPRKRIWRLKIWKSTINVSSLDRSRRMLE